MDVQDIAMRLGQAFKNRAKNQKTALLVVKIAVTIGAGIATLTQSLSIPAGTFPLPNAIGIVATLIALIGGLSVIIADKDTSEELEVARVAVDAARNLEAEFADIKYILSDAQKSTELYLAMKEMRDVIESSFNGSFEEIATIQTMLDAAERSLRLSFAFALEDHWTICVYRADTSQGALASLKCVAQLRSVTCDIRDARVWSEGIGITGIAYARESEVIVPDLASKDLGSIHKVPDPVSKGEDGKRYRSIIGVPVRVGGSRKRWGMVVATSDQPEHFTLDQSDGPKTAEPARALAAMIELLLAAHMR